MIRGTFTNSDRGYTGEIRSFGVREQVELRRVEGKDNDKAPDFRIHPADDDGSTTAPPGRRSARRIALTSRSS
ncbi:DUF736 family protein [Sphingobium soli]|uniref:DUF736 family protein n=1 Tax=Sphingobium soli TaxID=1591116 RepID=UPI00224C2AFF|nr:DUF736 family protein [Sphingobium soli]